MADEPTLIRDASSGNAKAIRELAKLRGVEGRDPALYPWAGDRWRRMHWAIMVVDPCVMLAEKGGRPVRHVRVSEGFITRNAEGRKDPPRDGDGRRVPAVEKTMPWPEWIWWTGTGGYPQKMRGWRPNKMTAVCFYKVPPAELPKPVAPPPPPPPPVLCGCGAAVKKTQKFCSECGKPLTVAAPLPPPPPPGAPVVPPPPP